MLAKIQALDSGDTILRVRKQGEKKIMGVFVNLSNHSSVMWSKEQYEAASGYGKVVDIPFPQIEASSSEEEIERLVEEYYPRIIQYDSPTVMVQGEFSFTYRMIVKLKEAGITVLTSCADRIVKESSNIDGSTNKVSLFKFVRFREY